MVDWFTRELNGGGAASYFARGSAVTFDSDQHIERQHRKRASPVRRQVRHLKPPTAPPRSGNRTAGTHRMTLFSTRKLALTFAIAISGIVFSASPGLSFSSEAQQMCSGDAMRLCSNEIPDIP